MPRKRPRNVNREWNEKKQKKHLVEFGEAHPIEDKFEGKFTSTAYSTKVDHSRPNGVSVVDSTIQEDVDENEAPNAFSELISVFGTRTTNSRDFESDEDDSDVEGENAENHSQLLESSSDDDAANDSSLEDIVHADDDDNEDNVDTEDTFSEHFENILEENEIEKLQISQSLHQTQMQWSQIGNFTVSSHEKKEITVIKNLDQMHIKKTLINNAKLHNIFEIENDDIKLSKYQCEMLSLIGRYKDLYYPNRTFNNGEDIRTLYTIHAVNHILKTRSKIVHHNSKLAKNSRKIDVEYRDQGLSRPKVLIVVPFKESAMRIVKIIENLLISDDKANIQNKKRFRDEFSADKDEEAQFKKKKISRPDDFQAIFAGNIDDSFRVGLAITKKSLRLYADFYSSDIIIASPLGLRTIIGAEGEKDRDFDFLSSIEVLILDQAEIFTMQNWDHVLHLMTHMHQQPKQSHGVDFSRVRMWCLNGWSKFYRQTLVFSSVNLPAISALFNQSCHNYDGKVRVARQFGGGTINQVVTQAPHVFHRFEANSVVDAIEERFNYFVSKLLPQFKDPIMSHTLIFIPSYFDFIRVRNYMKREDMSITQICEYTKDAKISRARNLFYHNKRHFMLYTERFHFYRRYHIKGIRHILFYELPSSPHFYSELCNFLHTGSSHEKAEVSCTVLYNKYDANILTEVVGPERSIVMLNSEKKSHMFVTGD